MGSANGSEMRKFAIQEKCSMPTLAEAKLHKTVSIVSIDESEIKPRLLEMGLYEGKKITPLYRAPLGDPIAVNVDGYVLSLRVNEAAFIHIAEDRS